MTLTAPQPVPIRVKFLDADGQVSEAWQRFFLSLQSLSVTLSGGHALLDGAQDTDTLAAAPVRGALIVGNSTPKWARLPIGPTNQVLTATTSGDAAWMVPQAVPHTLLDGVQDTDTLAGTVVAGDLIVGNATPAWARLGLGSTNTVLRSNGTAASWHQVALLTDVSDYIAGTWTPVDASGAALTFATALGNYIALGKAILVTFQVVYPATGSGASAKIGGLPFNSSASNTGGLSIGYASGVPANTTILQVVSQSQLAFWTAGVATTNVQLTGATIAGGGLYISA